MLPATDARAGGALFMNKGFGVAKKKPPRKKSKVVGFSYTGQLRPGTQTPKRSVRASWISCEVVVSHRLSLR